MVGGVYSLKSRSRRAGGETEWKAVACESRNSHDADNGPNNVKINAKNNYCLRHFHFRQEEMEPCSFPKWHV